MNRLRLHIPKALERSPEIASLAILDQTLSVCETALLAAYPEIHHGLIDDAPRGSSVLRANAIIARPRRLAADLAAYREAIDRDAFREARLRRSDRTF